MIFNREQSVGYWAKHITMGFHAKLERRVERYGLTAPECILILIISEFQCNTLVEIARIVEHAHPSVLRHIDGLEKSGYLRRTPHPDDRRKKMIQLTDQGNALAPQIKNEMSIINQQAITGFSEEDVEQVLANMKRITSNLGCHPDLCAGNEQCHRDREMKDGETNET